MMCNRQTDRQTDRQTNKQTNKQTNRQTNKHRIPVSLWTCGLRNSQYVGLGSWHCGDGATNCAFCVLTPVQMHLVLWLGPWCMTGHCRCCQPNRLIRSASVRVSNRMVTRDLWFLMAGPNYPHWGDSDQIQEISVAPNLRRRLTNFVIFTTGLHFRNGFMFLCFLQFEYFILRSHSSLSDRFTPLYLRCLNIFRRPAYGWTWHLSQLVQGSANFWQVYCFMFLFITVEFILTCRFLCRHTGAIPPPGSSCCPGKLLASQCRTRTRTARCTKCNWRWPRRNGGAAERYTASPWLQDSMSCGAPVTGNL